jgi:hypothetical protein
MRGIVEERVTMGRSAADLLTDVRMATAAKHVLLGCSTYSSQESVYHAARSRNSRQLAISPRGPIATPLQ